MSSWRDFLSGLLDTLKDLMPTWAEWHAIVIGWGDGVAFTYTDWDLINLLYDEEEKMEQELHYYKAGLAFGRLTLVLIIASLLIRFLG